MPPTAPRSPAVHRCPLATPLAAEHRLRPVRARPATCPRPDPGLRLRGSRDGPRRGRHPTAPALLTQPPSLKINTEHHIRFLVLADVPSTCGLGCPEAHPCWTSGRDRRGRRQEAPRVSLGLREYWPESGVIRRFKHAGFIRRLVHSCTKTRRANGGGPRGMQRASVGSAPCALRGISFRHLSHVNLLCI